VNILTAIHGNQIPAKSLSRVLSNLNMDHDDKEGVSAMRKKLKSYITVLRKGKEAERSQFQKNEVLQRHKEALQKITRPQLVLQSLKDKIINLVRRQTSSKALATFTCASCAESVLLRCPYVNHAILL
jgi:hypothetical protein